MGEPKLTELRGELEGIADRLERYQMEIARLAGEQDQVNGPMRVKAAQLVVDLRDAVAKCDPLWTDRGREVLADA